LSRLAPLVEKEVKDLLRDPRIYIGLIVPVLIMPVIGLAMSTAMTSSIESVTSEGVKVAVLDFDRTGVSRGFIRFLNGSGLKVYRPSSKTVEDAVKELEDADIKVLIVVPDGFGSNVTSYRRARVDVYFLVKSVGFGEAGLFSIVENVLNLYAKVLSESFISSMNSSVNPEEVREPLNTTSRTVIKGEVLNVPPQALFGQFFMGYGIMVPLVLTMVSVTVAQIAATATAVENEEKTLETLLTLPVSRYEILLAKLIGSTVVAVLGTLFFIIGFAVYFQSFFTVEGLTEGIPVSQLKLPPPPPETFFALSLSLLIAVFFTTSLGVIIGALSSDVRISNSLIGIVIVPIMIPAFLIMYGDVEALPLGLQILVYALPPSYPMLIARDMLLAELPVEALYGIPYSAGLTAFLLLLTSRLLVPEKLLSLQYKILARRMKGRKSRG